MSKCPRSIVPKLMFQNQWLWQTIIGPAINLGLFQVEIGFGAVIINYNSSAISLVLKGYDIPKEIWPMVLDHCQIIINVHRVIKKEELLKNQGKSQGMMR